MTASVEMQGQGQMTAFLLRFLMLDALIRGKLVAFRIQGQAVHWQKSRHKWSNVCEILTLQ